MSAPRLEHRIERATGEGWELVGRWFGSTPTNALHDWAFKKSPGSGRYRAVGKDGEYVERVW